MKKKKRENHKGIQHIVLHARKELGTSARLKDIRQWLETRYAYKANPLARMLLQELKECRRHDIDKLLTKLMRSMPRERIGHSEITEFAKKYGLELTRSERTTIYRQLCAKERERKRHRCLNLSDRDFRVLQELAAMLNSSGSEALSICLKILVNFVNEQPCSFPMVLRQSRDITSEDFERFFSTVRTMPVFR